MIIQAVLCVGLIFTTTSGELIRILNKNYWKQILYEENGSNILKPNGLHYTANETLIHMKNQTLCFRNSDYKKYKILQRQKPTRKPNNFIDKAGNSISHVNGYLFYKKTNLLARIVSKDLQRFKDIVMDANRNTTYMIGLNKSTLSGGLFAMNTNEPHMVADSIFVDKIIKMGENLHAISLDEQTGDVALIEINENTGWRLVLLVVNDFKLLIDEESKLLQNENGNEITTIDTETRPGLHNKFNNDIKDMTKNILSLNFKECNSRINELLIDNRKLVYQISILSRKHRYLLKGDGIYFHSPRHLQGTTKKYNSLTNRLKSVVQEVEKNITTILNTQTVHWVDEDKQCVNKTQVPEEKAITSCGVINYDPTLRLFPWTVAVLGSSASSSRLPYEFLCYGTLIHPKAVLIALECSEKYHRYNSIIVRIGVLDMSLLNTNQPSKDIKVTGTMFIGVRVLILEEEFKDNSKIGVACSPTNIEPKRDAKCFGLTKQNDIFQATLIEFSQIHQCDKKIADTRFFCVDQTTNNTNECRSPVEKIYIEAIYCPYPDNPQRYMIYGHYMRSTKCTEVLVNQVGYNSQTIDELKKINMAIT